MSSAMMFASSIDPFSNGPAFNRRPDSDDDSAISLSLDNAEVEKRRFSVIKQGPAPPEARRPWTWRSCTVDPVFFFLPSFVSRRLQGLPAKGERHAGVMALDGLRGLACLIVLNERLTANYDASLAGSSHVTIGDSTKTLLHLPITRTLWSGSTMVNIFFIISGYVLSYKPLRYVCSGNSLDAHRHLTSSTIRRGLRLYLPALFAIYIAGVLSWFGVFDRARSTFELQNNVYELTEPSPPRFVSFAEQMKDVSRHASRLFDVWYKPDHDLHAGNYDLYAWATPVEFRNSMTLLLSLLAVSRLRTNFRLITTLAFIAFAISTHNRSVVLFLSGMFLADIDQLRFTHTRHISYSSYSHETSSKVLSLISPRSPLYPLLFLVGFSLTSIPVHGAENDFLYKHVYNIIPSSFPDRSEWIRLAGSVMIVWAVANSTTLRPLFTNRCVRYLGKISYSLYLVQGSIIKIVIHPYLPVFYHKLGDGTKTGQSTQQMVTAWVFGMALCLSASVWVADVFWRAVELPCTRFTKWLEVYVSEDDEVGSPSHKRWE